MGQELLELCAGHRGQARRPEGQKGFCVLPRRWVVERTFAWLGQWRRLSKDYEQSPWSEMSFIQIAMTGLMLNRLTG